MLHAFQIITGAVGLAMSAGYYMAAYKIFKNKSANDISRGQYILLGVGTTIWTIYGFYIMDWVIIAGFLLGMIGAWFIVFLTYLYEGKTEKC
ncbi:MAG: SemiSWEET family transporter [Minisyncoccia bacterium]